MEFNWKMFRWALIFGAGMGLLQIINVLTAYSTPPDWWTVVRFAILPALGTFIATVLQSCPKPDLIKKVGAVCLLLFLAASLFGCASLGSQATKIDLQNYEANKTLARNGLKTWSFNSGFIICAGFTDKIKFPINSAGEARALLQSPSVVLSLAELDEIAKKLVDEAGKPYWSDEDYGLGCSLGLKSRAAVMGSIDLLKMFPTLAPYLATIFP